MDCANSRVGKHLTESRDYAIFDSLLDVKATSSPKLPNMYFCCKLGLLSLGLEICVEIISIELCSLVIYIMCTKHVYTF